ncbi:DdrH [Deinococcus lacus]|uniref:DdrH n=1 Tax=Deinococcus lacus TaxID=392561 RepID=A0ABW1YDR4_9DEIO
MTSSYAEFLQQLRDEYGEHFSQMPLPDGLEEHLKQLIQQGDQDSIQFMLKVAWQFGAQAGFAAGLRVAKQGSAETGEPSPSFLRA